MYLVRPTVPRIFRVIQAPARPASVPGATIFNSPSFHNKTPPSPEEYNHLDPKGWQIGVDGKILPRLPEGTRVGKLVMGKYGLYNPRVRKEAEAFREAIENGAMSQTARKFDRTLYNIQKCLLVISVLSTGWCLASFIVGEPLWPYKGLKPPGSV